MLLRWGIRWILKTPLRMLLFRRVLYTTLPEFVQAIVFKHFSLTDAMVTPRYLRTVFPHWAEFTTLPIFFSTCVSHISNLVKQDDHRMMHSAQWSFTGLSLIPCRILLSVDFLTYLTWRNSGERESYIQHCAFHRLEYRNLTCDM